MENLGYFVQYVFILTTWEKCLSANWVRIQPAENYFHLPEVAFFPLTLYFLKQDTVLILSHQQICIHCPQRFWRRV
jgi:hypothetical protein